MKQISLISTLFNEEDNVLNFLESYKNQTRYADEYVIVDGGSTDNTAKIVEDFANMNPELNIRLIVDETCSKKYSKGPIAKGRNVAITNAKYDYIAATDAGCILSDNWFEELVKPWEEDDSIDVISGWYTGIQNNEFQKIYNELFMPKLDTIDRNEFLPSSRNIAFKKNAWNKIGGYPEETYTAEDTLFDINLKKAKLKFFFNEKAIVSWELPASLDEAKKKHFNYSYGDGQYNFYFGRFLYMFLGVIFPIKILFNKKKNFKIRYTLLLFSVLGYFKGLLNRVS